MLRTFGLFSLFQILLLFGTLSFATDGFFNDFKDGVDAYQKLDYKKASELFTKALAQSPKNAAVLTNLATAELELGQKGLAIAHFRQALSVEPGLSTAATGLKRALAKLQVKEIPHRLETYETIRGLFLEPISLLSYLILSAISLFSGGWLILTYLGQKRRARLEESAGPAAPVLGYLFSILFVFCIGFSTLKAWDSSQSRATVIESKISAQAAPGENQAALFDLYEGLEVIIRHTQEGWMQVSYPGGLSGWVPSKSLLVTTL